MPHLNLWPPQAPSPSLQEFPNLDSAALSPASGQWEPGNPAHETNLSLSSSQPIKGIIILLYKFSGENCVRFVELGQLCCSLEAEVYKGYVAESPGPETKPLVKEGGLKSMNVVC